MKYICAQPATLYYAWQIDVMLHSFVNAGVNLEDVHIVCAIHNEIDPYFDRLMKKYLGVSFSFYEDTRYDNSYISSIRPHILKKHFSAFPELEEEVLFYHDSDIVLTKPLDVDHYIRNGVCYLSDTISYIGYEYIKSKGDDVLNQMINIVGIDEEVVKQNQSNSGGAQYIIKNVDRYFWYDVEKDSTRLFKEVSETNRRKKEESPEYHEIQIWCADMWAVLWNLWKRKKQTKVVKELDFSWATTSTEMWHKNAIYHNAGVTSVMNNMFYKGKYMSETPPLDMTDINDKKCSYMYYKLIQQTLI